MSDPWVVVVDSEGFIARIVGRGSTFTVEWRNTAGVWRADTVALLPSCVPEATIGAMLAIKMERSERLAERRPNHFVVFSRCRSLAMGFRFYDDGKYRWHVSDGWIPDEKERSRVEMDYLGTCDSVATALDIAIDFVLFHAANAKDEDEREVDQDGREHCDS